MYTFSDFLLILAVLVFPVESNKPSSERFKEQQVCEPMRRGFVVPRD
jgi:hypothetical protein